MGFRYWLADLISGGELTRLDMMADAFAENAYDTAWRCRGPLVLIAAQVTPGANATVKRMGRIAEEALK